VICCLTTSRESVQTIVESSTRVRRRLYCTVRCSDSPPPSAVDRWRSSRSSRRRALDRRRPAMCRPARSGGRHPCARTCKRRRCQPR
jgi:hypothetical protein